MNNFFIIHGSDGHSKENWFPWLKNELEKRGFECIVPDFPCEDGHQLTRWYDVINNYKDKITSESIFIAHSRGVSFVLNLLTDFDYQINSLYIVGGFIEYLWEKEGGDTFFARPFDFAKIKNQCEKFINYYSDNDPYIPVEHSKKITQELNAKEIEIKGAGHFNTEAGYTTFSELLKYLEKVF